MSLERLRDIVAPLQVYASALAALETVLAAKIREVPLDSSIKPYIDEVMAALNMPDTLEAMPSSELAPILAEIHTFRAQNFKLQSAMANASGWMHTDADMLQAAGDASKGFAVALKSRIAPKLEGLLPRLESNDGRFLDIGVGVAALSIRMAHLWPNLHITGIDPWQPALALAHKNVQEAQLAQRIELRQQMAQDLSESGIYDLAWLPGLFIPESAIAAAAARIVQALRPGAWLLCAVVRPGDDPLGGAVVRLRTALFGGCLLASQEIEVLLRNAGFVQVHTLATSRNALVNMVAARRKL
jgi:SAM-dependent methyltransferase